jgi:hypothetical protein
VVCFSFHEDGALGSFFIGLAAGRDRVALFRCYTRSGIGRAIAIVSCGGFAQRLELWNCPTVLPQGLRCRLAVSAVGWEQSGLQPHNIPIVLIRSQGGISGSVTEDPIHLFAKRSERYPEPDELDTVQGSARAALSAIPIIGESLTEVLSLVLAPAVSRRRDEWLKELSDALDDLEAKVHGFRVQDLANNDGFVSAAIQATRTAVANHNREKRQHLRNALLNIATGRGLEEEWQDFLMQLVEDLTALHVRLLRYFDAPFQFVSQDRVNELNEHVKVHGVSRASSPTAEMELSLPDLRRKRVLYEPILQDLHARRLLISPLEYLQDEIVPDEHGVFQRRITNLGARFLAFIKAPEI